MHFLFNFWRGQWEAEQQITFSFFCFLMLHNFRLHKCPSMGKNENLHNTILVTVINIQQLYSGVSIANGCQNAKLKCNLMTRYQCNLVVTQFIKCKIYAVKDEE
uniref:Uncharacterized protein n=1 Tax=Romanomermis culicivorax TaxID=13658 RepID=A0A915KYY7_ROMCU